jgi:hypothetical protein
MTYLWISRIIFWSFVVHADPHSLDLHLAVAHGELDREQEALAEAHRRRRRIERFNPEPLTPHKRGKT